MRRLLILATLMLAVPVPANAQRYPDCAQLADLDRTFRGCTAILQRGKRESRQQRAVAYRQRGLAHGMRGSYDRAVVDFTEALKLSGTDAKAFYYRALSYFNMGDVHRAIVDFDEAIKLEPNHAESYYNRGVLYGMKGDVDRAIADYDRAIKLKPRYAQAFVNRGYNHVTKGAYHRAISDFDQAIRLDPRDALAYHGRGNAYAAKGLLGRAILDYDRAIELNPRNAKVYQARASVYKKLRKQYKDFDCEKIIRHVKSIAERYEYEATPRQVDNTIFVGGDVQMIIALKALTKAARGKRCKIHQVNCDSYPLTCEALKR